MGITSIPQSLFAPWTRKHDKPNTFIFCFTLWNVSILVAGESDDRN